MADESGFVGFRCVQRVGENPQSFFLEWSGAALSMQNVVELSSVG